DHLGVAVQAGGDFLGGVLVAAGEQEVLAAGGEVRRERAADVPGADDGHRAVRNSHLWSTFRDVVSAPAGGRASLHNGSHARREAGEGSPPGLGDSPGWQRVGRVWSGSVPWAWGEHPRRPRGPPPGALPKEVTTEAVSPAAPWADWITKIRRCRLTSR